MLSGPAFSPMQILLLLLYGLLLAFSFVLWNVLNLRNRARQDDRESTYDRHSGGTREPKPVVRERQVTPARRIPPVGVRPEPTVTVPARQPVPARQAAETPAQKPWLRTPAASEPESPTPRRESVLLRRSTARAQPERSAATPPVKPEVQPAASPERERPAGADRKRNEDAFERFLRSSRNDPDAD